MKYLFVKALVISQNFLACKKVNLEQLLPYMLKVMIMMETAALVIIMRIVIQYDVILRISIYQLIQLCGSQLHQTLPITGLMSLQILGWMIAETKASLTVTVHPSDSVNLQS